jgi:PPP family 3-phenylpropionic acid transporter
MPLAGARRRPAGRARGVLAALLVAGAALGLGYGLVPAGSAALLLLVGLAQHAATGPIGPLPDALAVRAAAGAAAAGGGPRRGRGGGLDYGVVRGAGAAAFIAGAALAGLAVEAAGSSVVVLWVNAGLFALAAGAALLLPRPAPDAAARLAEAPLRAGRGPGRGAVAGALAIPALPPPAAGVRLIAGSHAFYTAFARCAGRRRASRPRRSAGCGRSPSPRRWRCSSCSAARCSRGSGPGGLCALAAAAGALRWAGAWPPRLGCRRCSPCSRCTG